MKAMIFAAGLGTRLHPLTENKPKALVEVRQKPMLGHLLHRLADFGIRHFVVNVHHYAGQIEDYLALPEFSTYQIQISDERDALLDTGGALVKARPLLRADEPVLVHNVDVWSQINIRLLIDFHNAKTALASLAVSRRETSRYLLFDHHRKLCGWKNKKTGETRMSRNACQMKQYLAFSGIQVLSQDFLDMMEDRGSFSIIDEYLRLSADYEILGWEHDKAYWMDLGRPEMIKRANKTDW